MSFRSTCILLTQQETSPFIGRLNESGAVVTINRVTSVHRLISRRSATYNPMVATLACLYANREPANSLSKYPKIGRR